jgi:hAT family C-terminal dimerisation region
LQIINMFEPLETFFKAAPNCPQTVKRFFDEDTALFWLKFVEAQLSVSNKYVLKTETRDVASFEVAAEMQSLREVVERRKNDNYIPYEAQVVFRELTAEIQEAIRKNIKTFYSSLGDYIKKWSMSLDGTEIFSWMQLIATPDWEKNVVPAAEFLLNHQPLAIKMDELYDEHTLLQQHVDKSLSRWEAIALPTEGRWLELLKSLNEEHRPIPNFSTLAQYALAIPGTSTEVERLFSIIKNVWEPEKGRLDPKTLEAHLDIKFNCKKSCSEFFHAVKSDKKLLSQVQGGEKYTNVSDS